MTPSWPTTLRFRRTILQITLRSHAAREWTQETQEIPPSDTLRKSRPQQEREARSRSIYLLLRDKHPMLILPRKSIKRQRKGFKAKM
jgi:hypothetical protein